MKEIARERGVSYEAVVHTRDRRNIEPVGKRGRSALYDPAAFEEKKTSEVRQQRLDYRVRYEKAKAEKLEIETAIKRGDLIDRSLIARVFSELYNVDRSILLNIGPAQADTISAVLEKGGADRTLKIQKIIDSEIYQALGAKKAIINKFLRSINAGELEDDLPETKPQTKQAAKPKPAAAKRKKKPKG